MAQNWIYRSIGNQYWAWYTSHWLWVGSIPRFFDFQNSEFSETLILKQKNSCILNPGIEHRYFENNFWRGFSGWTSVCRVHPKLNWCWWQTLETILLTTNWDIGDGIDDCSHQHPQFIHQDVYSVTNFRKYFHQLIVNNIDVPVAIGELAISMLAKDIWDALCWQLCDVGDRFEMLVTDSSHQKSHQHHHCHFDRVFFPTSRSLHLEVNSGYSP